MEVASNFACFAPCGMTGQYDNQPTGPRNTYGILETGIKLQGFPGTSRLVHWIEFKRNVTQWIVEGAVK